MADTLLPVLGSILPPAEPPAPAAPRADIRHFQPALIPLPPPPQRAESPFKKRFDKAVQKRVFSPPDRQELVSRAISLERELRLLNRELDTLNELLSC